MVRICGELALVPFAWLALATQTSATRHAHCCSYPNVHLAGDLSSDPGPTHFACRPGSELTLAGIDLNLLGAILNVILFAIVFVLLRGNAITE
jgi:hypothetical protein